MSIKTLRRADFQSFRGGESGPFASQAFLHTSIALSLSPRAPAWPCAREPMQMFYQRTRSIETLPLSELLVENALIETKEIELKVFTAASVSDTWTAYL